MNAVQPNEHEAKINVIEHDKSQLIRFRRTILICAALVAIFGLVALAGWMLGRPELFSLGLGYIPMAPSTASLLTLSAIALVLRFYLPHRGAYLAGLFINVGVSVTATLLLILSSQGILPDAENLGFTIAKYAGNTPLGHISPVAAFCLLISSLSYLASHSVSTICTWRASLAGLLASLLILINFLFVLAYLYGEPFFYGGAFIPPSLPSCLSILILNAALLCLATQHNLFSQYLADTSSRTTFAFILMFSVLAMGIVITGFLYFRSIENTYRLGVKNQLSSIGDLKVGELGQWRKDRLELGSIISRTEVISTLVKRAYREGNDPEALRLLKGLLGNYLDSQHYDEIRLLDPAGATLLSYPDNRLPTCSEMRKRAPEVILSQKVTLVDFYRNDHDKKVYLALLVPIKDSQNAKKIIGIISLRINPETYLYPFIKLWPIPSNSSETLLVRRDGTDALFLNELRFRTDSALNQRTNLEKIEQPSVKAVLGQKGIVEGRDYRGIPVIAYVRDIPGSPWFLVAKTDNAEVYAQLSERLWLLSFFVGIFLMGAGLGFGLIWWLQRVKYYKEKLVTVEALRESEERFRRAIEESPLPIMIHADDGAVLSLSRAWTEISGYELSDIPTVEEWTYRAYGNKHASVDAEIKTLYTLDHRVSEGEFVVNCKDGSKRIWDFSSMSIGQFPDGRRMAISMAADVTDRKEKEKELARKNAELERYSYTVSHDLKSPLITIRSYSGSIRRDLAMGRQDRLAGDLGRIEAASGKMSELLDDLLELSRIGQVIYSPELVALNELVNDVLANLSGSIREHGVQVTVQPDLPMVFCDRQRMAEVIQNLLENAIKYRDQQRKPQILVGVRREHGNIIYFVQDNGIGIDSKYQENVFGLFNKLNARSDGSGIGLALVRRIIEVQGGSVWFESRGEGFGSTFCFTLENNKYQPEL